MASGILSDWYFITFFNGKITIVIDFSKKSKDEKIYCVYIRFVLHLNDKQLKNTITMKKIILLLALCFTANNFFAQTTDPNQLKNEGNDALNAKNYAVAYEKYSEYLK